MLYTGGCHCENIGVKLRLSRSPEQMALRSCSCAFCRAHGTRTLSDRDGLVEITAGDCSLVERYRFGSRTADYLLCRRCGVYVGAVCGNHRACARVCVTVLNVNCLDDRAAFRKSQPHLTTTAKEATDAQPDRRATNWMPVMIRETSI